MVKWLMGNITKIKEIKFGCYLITLTRMLLSGLPLTTNHLKIIRTVIVHSGFSVALRAE